MLFVFCALHASGAEQVKERPKLPPELDPVLALAMAAPPEFAASALLRLTSRTADKDLRREFIDMAFRLGGKAQHPVRLVSFPGSEVDTRTGYVASALKLKLDALSLQARAVEDMAALNPVRAREMFAEITRPALTPATCEDSLLPDVSPYYDALRAVSQGAFSPKERAKAEHLTFVTTMLSGVSSLAELAPAAGTLLSLDWPRQQFEIALGTLMSRLESVPLDSRSFLYFSKAFDDAAGAIVNRAKQLGTEPGPFVEAYRQFLVTQFRGPHCADSGKPTTRVVQLGQGTDLFGEAIRGDRPAIGNDEMTPEHVEGEMQVERFWQSAAAQRIYAECLKLRQGSDGQTISEGVRRSREWTRQLTDFLNTLANWRPADEATERGYYHQKAIVYQALLDLAPPGDLSDRVIESFVEFLKLSNLQQQDAVEWFGHARSTVDRVRPSHPEQASKILAAYRASGNIMLMLEAMLNQLAPVDPYFQASK